MANWISKSTAIHSCLKFSLITDCFFFSLMIDRAPVLHNLVFSSVFVTQRYFKSNSSCDEWGGAESRGNGAIPVE